MKVLPREAIQTVKIYAVEPLRLENVTGRTNAKEERTSIEEATRNFFVEKKGSLTSKIGGPIEMKGVWKVLGNANRDRRGPYTGGGCLGKF